MGCIKVGGQELYDTCFSCDNFRKTSTLYLPIYTYTSAQFAFYIIFQVCIFIFYINRMTCFFYVILLYSILKSFILYNIKKKNILSVNMTVIYKQNMNS